MPLCLTVPFLSSHLLVKGVPDFLGQIQGVSGGTNPALELGSREPLGREVFRESQRVVAFRKSFSIFVRVLDGRDLHEHGLANQVVNVVGVVSRCGLSPSQILELFGEVERGSRETFRARKLRFRG